MDEQHPQDIEEAARKLFFIDESIPIFVTTKVLSSDSTRARVDPRLWTSVGMDSQEVWIETSTGQSNCRLVGLSFSYPSEYIVVKTEHSSVVGDISRALGRKYPELSSGMFTFRGSTDYDAVMGGFYTLERKCAECVKHNPGYGKCATKCDDWENVIRRTE